MNEHAPTTEIVRSIIASKQSDWFDITYAEGVVWFDTWLEDLIREAREQAWQDGERAGTRNQRDFQLYKDLKITDAEYKSREALRANPYRAT